MPTETLDLVELGIHHEQQHQELIVTDVKNGLYANPLRPAYRENPHTHEERMLLRRLRGAAFLKASFKLALMATSSPSTTNGLRHKVYLQPFRLASRLVTNGEYLEFMRDGGYSQPLIWLSDGWDTVRNNPWNAPLYWEQRDGDWWNYTIEGMQPVNLDEPVCHVSYYEADAFARWSGARLPTEFEWEIAARSIP